MIMQIISHSEEETMLLGFKLSKLFQKGQIICLDGELGAGKTTFTQGLLKALNYKNEVTSPTFTLMHEYNADIPVLHCDMYRIESYDDLFSTGFFDYLNGEWLVLIEWSDKIKEYLPKENIIHFNFTYTGTDNQRQIEIKSDSDG